MFDSELLQTLTNEAPDDRSQETRKQVCRQLSAALRETGATLWTHGWMIGGDRERDHSPFAFGDDAVVGLATIAQVAGELCAGTVLLLEQGNMYSAAALLRQIVETEYLSWAFVEDKEEAALWLRSTRDERLQIWQPRHIRHRARGRFRAEDYARHCESGGHPTPDARAFLPEHNKLPISLLWLELAHHGVSTWRYIISGVRELGYGEEVAPNSSRDFNEAIQVWERTDRLSMLKREHADRVRTNRQALN